MKKIAFLSSYLLAATFCADLRSAHAQDRSPQAPDVVDRLVLVGTFVGLQLTGGGHEVSVSAPTKGYWMTPQMTMPGGLRVSSEPTPSELGDFRPAQ
jgi:hypothetical protein